MFKITEYVEFDAKGRAVCPSCALDGKAAKKNLALIPNTDGAYKCHRGCTPEQIRDALGNPKEKVVPSALATRAIAPGKLTVPPQKVKESCEKLLNSNGPAKQWLHQRGITDQMIARYALGITRSKAGEQMLYAITIPVPADDQGTAYFQKKRVAPWLPEEKRPKEYRPWVQAGIPKRVWFSYLPAEAKETWLCEGEWDAILLGWQVRGADLPIAVASFTAGCDNVPPADQLEQLPGQVIIFYDRNDKPLPNGDRPGEKSAKKVAVALGDRARIGAVPMTDGCEIPGWDVSDALNSGWKLEDFVQAAAQAVAYQQPKTSKNPLWDRLTWNDDLMDRAPEYTEWLVPDLLTADELFLLAAGPRAGKSLLAMTLAKATAEGGSFLGRPVTKGTVLYVCLEDGEAKLKERETAQGWARGLPVAWFQKFKLSELPDLKEIAAELDPRLIILDTLSRVKDSSISESSAEMSQYLEPLQEMAKELACCVLLLHHTGKVSAENAGSIDIFDTIRGSSSIRAVCRGSMVIAASDNNYRLLVENGWGKHDLNVVLDSNTWTWQLIGEWRPGVNQSQRDQIVDFLKQCGQATIEQIHEGTRIPKKSLYEQLSRLQSSSNPNEKIIKEGGRRNYTYRLALFNTIQQLNSVLNSENPEGDSDRDAIQQKNIFPISGDQRKGDHKLSGEGKDECNEILRYPELITSKSPGTFVEYSDQGVSNVGGEGDTPIQQLFNSYSTVEYKSLKQGDWVEVLTEEGWKPGVYNKPGQGSFLSRRTKKLDEMHWVTVGRRRRKVALSDIRELQDID